MEYIHGDDGNSQYALHSGYLHSTFYLIHHQPFEQNYQKSPFSYSQLFKHIISTIILSHSTMTNIIHCSFYPSHNTIIFHLYSQYCLTYNFKRYTFPQKYIFLLLSPREESKNLQTKTILDALVLKIHLL